jgi:DNA-binding CsgD family transcriptional regulator
VAAPACEPLTGVTLEPTTVTPVDPSTDGRSRLVGRAAELRRLQAVVAGGDGLRIGLVGGEAGIGKSRVVDEALASALPSSLVIRLHADVNRRARPFGAFVSGIEVCVRDWSAVPAPLSARAPEVRALLAPVVPGLPADDDLELTSTDSLERAAIDLLRHLAPDVAPVVVVADDLHWMDPETIGLVHQLVAGVPGLDDAVVLGTYRVDGLLARSPLSALLAAVERRHDGVNIRLDHLGLDDVADFSASVLGGDVPYRAVKALHQRSGGNPFFLEELLAAAGDVGVQHLADLPLPWTISELLRDTVHALSDEEREVVECAAVLGQRVPFDLLARVTGLDEHELIVRLRGIVAAGLLREDEVDVFSFRHALVREAVAGALLGRERRRLHEKALDVLRSADHPDDEAIVHHAAGAGRVDEMLVAVRRAANVALARGAPYQALEFAEAGLAEAPDDLVLAPVATRAAWLVGALDDARAHGARWVAAAADAGDEDAECEALRVLMRIEWDGGDQIAHQRGIDRLREFVDRQSPGPPRAAALADLAQAAMLRGRNDQVVELAERAIAEAESSGLDRVRVQAVVERCSANVDPDDVRLERMLAAVSEAERLGDDLTAARGLANIIDIVAVEHRRPLIERMRHDAERAGFAVLSSFTYATHVAQLASLTGDRAELERWLADAWRWSRLSQNCIDGSWLTFYDELLVAEASDADVVCTHTFVDRAPGSSGTGPHVLTPLLGLARSGDHEAARRLLAGWTVPADHRKHELRNAPIVVEAALRAGVAPDAVRSSVHRAIPEADRSGPLWSAVLAMLDVAEHDRQSAASRVAELGDELESWLRGELHLRLAELALESGDDDDAMAHVVSASDLLARWPGWRRDRADRLRRQLERRAAPDADRVLSSRELEVVALVAEGLTNAQIAERLFIARKTVAVHVSNILAKLGMRSRTEVAAWAVRTGVVDTPPRRAG